MSEMNKVPAPEVFLMWCPDCGLSDRHRPIGSVFHLRRSGAKCPGKPIRLRYSDPSLEEPA